MTHQDRKPLARRLTERWICPSTRAFLEEASQIPEYTRFDFLHGYIYGRWPYLYIGVATGEHPLTGFIRGLLRFVAAITGSKSEDDRQAIAAEGYHGKVVTPEGARQLVSVKEEIRLKDLEQVIPYSAARDIVLMHPDHIVALQCPCRTSRPNPCAPLDVCLVVGEPFASFVAEHHPWRSRWINKEEACSILESEHARGHVHHAFFKDAMLGRFYAICNCCPCCCGAMQAMRNGTPMLAASGYVSAVERKLCIGCGDCVERCPFAALELLDGAVQVDEAKCMGCGVCVSTCELDALALVRDPSKGEPLEIRALMNEAIPAARESA